VSNIGPVAEKVNAEMPEAELEARVEAAIKENVWHQMAELLRGSRGVAARVKEGKTIVVGAIYDIATGSVEILGRHPEDKQVQAI
jgi:carbonic anhydrase